MKHRFRVRQGDQELSFSGEREFVEAMAARYLPALLGQGVEAPIVSASPEPDSVTELAVEASFPRVSSSFRPRVNISCSDLITMKQAKAPTDLVVVAAYYFEKYKQQESFTPGELQQELLLAPGWECQVVDEVLPVVVLQGYVEALSGDRYALTYKGLTYVRDGLA